MGVNTVMSESERLRRSTQITGVIRRGVHPLTLQRRKVLPVCYRVLQPISITRVSQKVLSSPRKYTSGMIKDRITSI